MDKLKKIIILFVSFYFLAVSLIIYSFLSPNFSKKECEAIRENFGKIKIGMSKKEVLLVIKKEPDYKLNHAPGLFPEQKTEWEIWMLCADLNSCIFVESLGREQCYEWHMIAFNSQTGKVIKFFSDDPDKVGFI